MFFAFALLANSAQAQVKIGDNLSMNMTGSLGVGYNGNFGTFDNSHGIFLNGQSTISGSYYSPNFLNFNVQPFYNRNQENSSFASVLNETGVVASANIFAGSRFPGSVSYGYRKDTGSTYGFLAPAGLVGDSTNQDFSVSWSELLPNVPSLTVSYADMSTINTLQETTETMDSGVRTFTALSNYRIRGYNMSAWYTHQNQNTNLPQFLAPINFHNSGSNNVFGVSVTHSLPLSGSFQAGFNHTGYDYQSDGYTSSGSTYTVDTAVNLRPTQKFTVGVQARYTNNLYGALLQTVVPGGVPIVINGDQNSRGVFLGEYATYSLGHNIMITAFGSSQFQEFQGQNLNSNQFGATVSYNYAKPLLGMLTFTLGLSNAASASDGDGSNGLGFVAGLNFRRVIRGWNVNADFLYTQNVQTQIASYTSSNFSYGAYVKKRFGADTYFYGSYRGIQNGITQFSGFSNRADVFQVVGTRGRWGVNGSYGQYNGTSTFVVNGTLQPNPLAPLLPADMVFFDGVSYGAGVSVAPVRKLVILANWYRFNSHTQSQLVFSQNNNNRIYAQASWYVRQLSFQAGYWRNYQLISSSALPGSTANTYYFTITRWFNAF